MKIPFLELYPAYQELKAEFDAAYHRVMESGWYLLGPELEAFETEFAHWCGTSQAVAVGSGLDAIVFILRAMNIGPGDEVIVPAQTFIATWFGVTISGAQPIGVDVCISDGTLDPELIESAITNRTRAIMPVHLFGIPADMDSINEIAKRNSLAVIEDAAQAHGATYRGRRCGSLSDAAAFSFYPGKNLGAFSDGGCITTDDAELAAKIRILRNYGAAQKYHHEQLGFNSRLDELQAAFLRVKLARLDEWNVRRTAQATQYLNRLASLPGIRLIQLADHITSSWHLFPIFSSNREALERDLRAAGIDTLRHYPICPPDAPIYQPIQHDLEQFPVAKKLADEEISLPIGPHQSLPTVGYICDQIQKMTRQTN